VIVMSGLPEQQYAVQCVARGSARLLRGQCARRNQKAVRTVLSGRRLRERPLCEILVADPRSAMAIPDKPLACPALDRNSNLANWLPAAECSDHATEISLSVKT